MEKQEFEDDIRARLEGHESVPSSDVWNRLDSQLESADQTRLIRSRNVYRAVAASLALVVVSYVSWQILSPASGKQQSVSEVSPEGRSSMSPEVPPPAEQAGSENSGALTQVSVESERTVIRKANMGNGRRGGLGSSDDFNGASLPASKASDAPASAQGSVPTDRALSDYPGLVRAVCALEIPIGPRLPLKIPRDLLLAYKVADARGRVVSPVREKSSVKSSWMAVGYSAGNYQQQVLAGSPDAGDSRSSALYYGQNIGKLALFTGLSLTEQLYNNTSNLAYGNAAVRKAVAADNLNTTSALSDFSATNTYQVNTHKRYLSVPVQAGWYVVDRKIKGMVTAGLMSDYFLSSTVSDVSGNYQSSVIRRGGGSSYAGWVFSGIAGTEWSWGVAGRYQVALSPGFRYALTPVYRKDAVSNGRSISADIGVRLRYFF